MRIALANPPFSKLIYGEEYSIKSVTPCLGLFYLQAWCSDIAEVEVFEGEFYGGNAGLIDAINAFEPDVLGVTSNTSTYPLCTELARGVRARMKLIGGPYASFRIRECLADFDVVFVGDGEIGLRSLLQGTPLPEVPGVAFLDEKGCVQQTPAAQLLDLDTIPYPNHSKMRLGQYQASPHRDLPAPFATMVTTRGCGFACSFCLSANGGLNGGRYRERSVENVAGEIRLLQSNHGIKSIQFWDDTFTMRKSRVREMSEALRKTGIQYVCNTRTDKIDEEVADLLVHSGCQGVFFGVESGDQEISDRSMRKGIRNEQVRRAVEICRRAGVRTTASFIFGAIDETPETVRETMDFALELDVDYVLFNVYTAHPGTHGYHEAIREGVIDEYVVDHSLWKDEPAGVPTVCRALSRRDLHIAKAEAYREYYTQRDAIGYGSIIETYARELSRLQAASPA